MSKPHADALPRAAAPRWRAGAGLRTVGRPTAGSRAAQARQGSPHCRRGHRRSHLCGDAGAGLEAGVRDAGLHGAGIAGGFVDPAVGCLCRGRTRRVAGVLRRTFGRRRSVGGAAPATAPAGAAGAAGAALLVRLPWPGGSRDMRVRRRRGRRDVPGRAGARGAVSRSAELAVRSNSVGPVRRARCLRGVAGIAKLPLGSRRQPQAKQAKQAKTGADRPERRAPRISPTPPPAAPSPPWSSAGAWTAARSRWWRTARVAAARFAPRSYSYVILPSWRTTARNDFGSYFPYRLRRRRHPGGQRPAGVLCQSGFRLRDCPISPENAGFPRRKAATKRPYGIVSQSTLYCVRPEAPAANLLPLPVLRERA